MRGGGGGLFVIVIEIKLQLVESPSLVTSVSFSWYSNATKLVIQQYQSLLFNDKTWSSNNNIFLAMDVDNAHAQITVVNFGTELSSFNKIIASLLATLPTPNQTATEQQDWLSFVYEKSGVGDQSGDLSQLLLYNLTYPLFYFKAKHLFYDQPISDRSLDQLIDSLTLGDGHGQINIEFGPWDGYLSAISANDTAFPYRHYKFGIQFMVHWNDTQSESKQLEWLDQVYSTVYNDSTKHAYINYIDRDVPDWMNVYYDIHQQRLMNIKEIYDSDNRFCFEKTIESNGAHQSIVFNFHLVGFVFGIFFIL